MCRCRSAGFGWFAVKLGTAPLRAIASAVDLRRLMGRPPSMGKESNSSTLHIQLTNWHGSRLPALTLVNPQIEMRLSRNSLGFQKINDSTVRGRRLSRQRGIGQQEGGALESKGQLSGDRSETKRCARFGLARNPSSAALSVVRGTLRAGILPGWGPFKGRNQPCREPLVPCTPSETKTHDHAP